MLWTVELDIYTEYWTCRCLYKELLSIHERDPHYDPYLNSQVGTIPCSFGHSDLMLRGFNCGSFSSSDLKIRNVCSMQQLLFSPVTLPCSELIWILSQLQVEMMVTLMIIMIMVLMLTTMMMGMRKNMIMMLVLAMITTRHFGFETKHSDLLQGRSIHTPQVGSPTLDITVAALKSTTS